MDWVTIPAARKGRVITEIVPARTRSARSEDTRIVDAVACSRAKQLQTHPFLQHKIVYVSRLSGGICCRSSIEKDSRCQPGCVQDTPCDPGEVHKEWGSGKNDRVLNEDEFIKKKGKYRTHVSDSNNEVEEKYSEVQVEPLARGSTPASYPEREEPKSSASREKISLYVRKSISVPSGREEL